METMTTFRSWPFLLLCVCGNVCIAQGNASTPRLQHQWHKIADLPPGSPVLIRQKLPATTLSCGLAWIDENAVACDIHANGQRVIFPIGTVFAIAPIVAPPPHVRIAPIVVGAVTGILAGGLLTNPDGGNEGAARIGMSVGAAVGAGIGYLIGRR
jgi:hypothetical protein